MSEKLIPLPKDHELWIRTLFDISNILLLSEQQYAIYWPMVDGFWTHTNTQRPKHGKSIAHYYSCRLSKTRISSKADPYPEENSTVKTRNTSFFVPIECKMRIKTTEAIPTPGFAKSYRIEQIIPANKSNILTSENQWHTHCHSIEESWKRKRSTFLTDIIRDELARGYSPAQVRDRLRGTGRTGGYERLESVGGAFIDGKDCANIGQSSRTGILDIRKLAPGTTLLEDWEQATVFLLEKGYFCKSIVMPGKNSQPLRGLVFAYPPRLNVLVQRGFLTIFDSTHKFNVHGFNLFTFICRNESAIWISGAHCLVENENSEILSVVLRQVYEWTNKNWKMQYPLTDNSAIEKAAVRKAFAEEGHLKNHLLCTVDSERTLSRRFRSEESKEIFGYMRHAIRVFTELECIELCQKAMTAAKTEADKRYIERDWLETRHTWALFARQHNALLLQVTTTNACEAWHARLKLGSGLRAGENSTHGIFGCVQTVHDCAHDVDNKALSAQLDSKTRHVSIAKDKYPSLQQFPFIIQKITATEESKISIRMEQQMPVPVRSIGEDGLYICHCLFTRRYHLPCQHVFHMDRVSQAQESLQLLTPLMWGIYLEFFGNGGMESYEGEETRPIQSIVRPNDNKTLRILKLAELNERIRSTFYQLDEVDNEQSTSFIEGIDNLITTILSLPTPNQVEGRTL